MAKPLVPDDLWAAIEPLLPRERPKPQGSRPRLSDRAALTGILFVLKFGLPWEMLPAEMGCGSGMSCWRRLRDWHEAGVWAALHRALLERLQAAGQIDWRRAALDSASLAAKRGGAEVGPNPTDRGKPGTKRHLVTDARGTPLGLMLSGANCHDSRMLAPTLDAVPPIRTGHRGRPRCRPGKLHADKAYDHRRCRQECRARGITSRIARRGLESSIHLGRHRWIVERTFAWLARYRRLTIRYERRANIHLAFTTLACALVCLGQIRRSC
ncbi:IS5 family transposase [Roseomonas xinghualingensis]|uniref:IS5 family transposase n=1 Tax=Roseomonas xinghualingensis TaxID=2986475 RepID=UPI0021F16DAD|nr:IS5 family transposase [Roseomonas sp. SXEYE001]MCV4210363.1 IS5 family transposase [Roseomonas sp. SXEYE001]